MGKAMSDELSCTQTGLVSICSDYKRIDDLITKTNIDFKGLKIMINLIGIWIIGLMREEKNP